jgi:restriction system protein
LRCKIPFIEVAPRRRPRFYNAGVQFRMHENSLFAVLLRSPWWVSLLIAVGLAAGLRLVIPELYAAFAALPFAVIAGYVGWRRLRAPGRAAIGRTLERLREMSWDEFSRALEERYRREGYTVNRLGGAAADFELVQGWRTTLLACKRWRAARTGIEPLRELDAARRARKAHECTYVSAGEVTEQARAFAARNDIRLLSAPELAVLLARADKAQAAPPGASLRSSSSGRPG